MHSSREKTPCPSLTGTPWTHSSPSPSSGAEHPSGCLGGHRVLRGKAPSRRCAHPSHSWRPSASR